VKRLRERPSGGRSSPERGDRSRPGRPGHDVTRGTGSYPSEGLSHAAVFTLITLRRMRKKQASRGGKSAASGGQIWARRFYGEIEPTLDAARWSGGPLRGAFACLKQLWRSADPESEAEGFRRRSLAGDLGDLDRTPRCSAYAAAASSRVTSPGTPWGSCSRRATRRPPGAAARAARATGRAACSSLRAPSVPALARFAPAPRPDGRGPACMPPAGAHGVPSEQLVRVPSVTTLTVKACVPSYALTGCVVGPARQALHPNLTVCCHKPQARVGGRFVFH
jgi:hypothetical protein